MRTVCLRSSQRITLLALFNYDSNDQNRWSGLHIRWLVLLGLFSSLFVSDNIKQCVWVCSRNP